MNDFLKKIIFDDTANKWLRIQGYIRSIIANGVTNEEEVFRKALRFANSIFENRFNFYNENGMMGKIKQLQEDIETHIKFCIRNEKEIAMIKMREQGIYKTMDEITLEDVRKLL